MELVDEAGVDGVGVGAIEEDDDEVVDDVDVDDRLPRLWIRCKLWLL